jgi:hypothetical protein|tara:strand:- start:181 stop:429 length:249 start_codon:yes stop_codon:yes gene_type:complete
MNIELSELKKMIKEEIENRYESKNILLTSPPNDSILGLHRGVRFDIPEVNRGGKILSEEIKKVYVEQMKEFIDLFFDQVNKK